MSEEKKPRKLSMGEVWKRTQLISHLSSRGKQGFDEVSKRCDMWLKLIGDEVKAKQKAEDEKTDAHKTAVALEQLTQEQKRAADTSERIEAQTAYLYEDRKRTKAKNRERGAASQAKADNTERQRAERDVKEALQMVRDRISHGEKNVIAICRRYCDWTDKTEKLHKGHFRRLTDKKLPSGEYADYAPLIGADGKPIKPETLARYYRKRYGAAKKRKANKAANKARTQAARDAKAAKHPRPTRRT